MIKTLNAFIFALFYAGCAAYQPQALPSTPDTRAISTHAERATSALKNLSEIAGEVIIFNPDLRAMRQDLNISDALVLSAGLLSDPSLTFSLAAPLNGTGLTNGVSAGIGWSLSSLFTRSNELERAEAERNMTIAGYAWQVRLSVANALLLAGRLSYHEEQKSIIVKNLTLFQKLYELTHHKAAANDETLLVQSSRKSMMFDWLDAKNKIDIQINAARHELNYLLGLSPSETFGIAHFDCHESHYDAKKLLEQAVEKRDDLVALRFAYQASDAIYRRNLLAQFPSFSIGLNWSADTSNYKTFGPSVTFDLPLWNRNKGGIALSLALRDKEKESYSAALSRTQSELTTLIEALKITQALLKTAQNETAADSAVPKALDYALQNGDVTISDYTARLNEHYLRELWMIGLRQTVFEQRIALALSSGSNDILGENK